MGLVETAMSTRGSLVVFEPKNVVESELKLSGKFVDLLAAYNVCVEMVKDTKFDAMVTKAQENMSKVTGVPGKLLHEIDVYQKETKPALVNKIQETEKAITNAETKLKALKKDEKIKDDKGNEVEVKPEDEKELKALVKYLKVSLKNSKKEFDEIKKSVAPLKKTVMKGLGVASEKSLANMVCSSKGTGAVGSLFEVGNFITGAIKSGKEPNDKDVDTMLNKLTDGTIEKGYRSSYANIAALAERTETDDEKNKPNSFGIDFSVISNDIEAVTSVCKGSIQKLIQDKDISQESLEKLKKETKKNFDTITDNCKAYCANSGLKGKEQKALIDLCKGICGLMVLNAWTALLKEFDNAYSGSGGSARAVKICAVLLGLVALALFVSAIAISVVCGFSLGLFAGLLAGWVVAVIGAVSMGELANDRLAEEWAEEWAAKKREENLRINREEWASIAVSFGDKNKSSRYWIDYADALKYANEEWTASDERYSYKDIARSVDAWWVKKFGGPRSSNVNKMDRGTLLKLRKLDI